MTTESFVTTALQVFLYRLPDRWDISLSFDHSIHDYLRWKKSPITITIWILNSRSSAEAIDRRENGVRPISAASYAWDFSCWTCLVHISHAVLFHKWVMSQCFQCTNKPKRRKNVKEGSAQRTRNGDSSKPDPLFAVILCSRWCSSRARAHSLILARLLQILQKHMIPAFWAQRRLSTSWCLAVSKSFIDSNQTPTTQQEQQKRENNS